MSMKYILLSEKQWHKPLFQSLKERVTQPTESVGGAIDVAVISKGDGFIWIKRKRYFDPDLNLRFIAKKQQEIQ